MFQSTHPGRGATRAAGRVIVTICFNPRTPGGVRPVRLNLGAIPLSFNPRTPGGVRHAALCRSYQRSKVSIHAPRAGCDGRTERASFGVLEFQSTHPGRGATSERHKETQHLSVSIHAPQAGCDRVVGDESQAKK